MGMVNGGDKIKVRFSSFGDTITGIDDFISKMETEKDTILGIKKSMQDNWTGVEADKAANTIGNEGDMTETIIGSINSMIEIQKNTRTLFEGKQEGFANAKLNY